jgi:hypothetical protein
MALILIGRSWIRKCRRKDRWKVIVGRRSFRGLILHWGTRMGVLVGILWRPKGKILYSPVYKLTRTMHITTFRMFPKIIIIINRPKPNSKKWKFNKGKSKISKVQTTN